LFRRARARLDCSLRITPVEAPFTDTLLGEIDVATQTTYSEPSVAEGAYTLRSLNLDGFTDGGIHVVEFAHNGPDGGGAARFNVDDVKVVVMRVPTLQGGGFEDAVGNPLDSPSWVEGSTVFSSSLCSIDLCGTGGSTAGPHAGAIWAWFGGVPGSTAETSSVSQVVRLPRSALVDLRFALWIGSVSSPFTDVLYVALGGLSVADFFEPSVAEGTYSQRVLYVDEWADGEPHTLIFQYIKGAGGNTANFNLDDVELVEVGCNALLVDGFETHDASNWPAVLP